MLINILKAGNHGTNGTLKATINIFWNFESIQFTAKVSFVDEVGWRDNETNIKIINTAKNTIKAISHGSPFDKSVSNWLSNAAKQKQIIARK